MKRITKTFFSMLCVLMFTITLSACGKPPAEPAEQWTDTQINSSNFSEYFSLDGYLGYEFNNGDGSLASPWGDNYYYYGSGVSYLEEKINSTFKYDYSDTRAYTLENFTTANDGEAQKPLKWRAIIFKAKQDVVLDWIKLRSYYAEDVPTDVYRTNPVSMRFEIKEYAQNSTQGNIVLKSVASVPMKKYMPDMSLKISIYGYEEDYYNKIVLFREYYGEEIYQWNKREVLVKKDQLFCIEFDNVSQITPKYKGFDNYEDFEIQTKLNFTFDDVSFDAKIKKR